MKTRFLWLVGIVIVQTAAVMAAESAIETCVLSQPSCRPGYGVTATFRWDAQLMEGDYAVFVHVRDADGRMLFQADHGTPTPTSRWSGRVEYERLLDVPPNTPPGDYVIVAGLWDPKANKRIPLKMGEGVTESDPKGYRIGKLKIAVDAPLPKLAAPTLNLDGYSVTFDEDFSGPELSVSPWGPGTRWIAHTPFNKDFGNARFTDPTKDFPFTIENGVLRIEARQQDGKWRAGLLSSCDAKGNGFAQRFGYFEMRAKFPKGEGVWPAFWLMGVPGLRDKVRPEIELDVVEYYGAHPHTLHSTVHWWGPEKEHRAEGKAFSVDGMTDDFHRYGLLVEEEHTRFYFDGVELWRIKTPVEAKVPLYLMVNLALGGGWPIDKTPNPSVMLVDYVRAYAKP